MADGSSKFMSHGQLIAAIQAQSAIVIQASEKLEGLSHEEAAAKQTQTVTHAVIAAKMELSEACKEAGDRKEATKLDAFKLFEDKRSRAKNAFDYAYMQARRKYQSTKVKSTQAYRKIRLEIMFNDSNALKLIQVDAVDLQMATGTDQQLPHDAKDRYLAESYLGNLQRLKDNLVTTVQNATAECDQKIVTHQQNYVRQVRLAEGKCKEKQDKALEDYKKAKVIIAKKMACIVDEDSVQDATDHANTALEAEEENTDDILAVGREKKWSNDDGIQKLLKVDKLVKESEMNRKTAEEDHGRAKKELDRLQKKLDEFQEKSVTESADVPVPMPAISKHVRRAASEPRGPTPEPFTPELLNRHAIAANFPEDFDLQAFMRNLRSAADNIQSPVAPEPTTLYHAQPVAGSAISVTHKRAITDEKDGDKEDSSKKQKLMNHAPGVKTKTFLGRQYQLYTGDVKNDLVRDAGLYTLCQKREIVKSRRGEEWYTQCFLVSGSANRDDTYSESFTMSDGNIYYEREDGLFKGARTRRVQLMTGYYHEIVLRGIRKS